MNFELDCIVTNLIILVVEIKILKKWPIIQHSLTMHLFNNSLLYLQR